MLSTAACATAQHGGHHHGRPQRPVAISDWPPLASAEASPRRARLLLRTLRAEINTCPIKAPREKACLSIHHRLLRPAGSQDRVPRFKCRFLLAPRVRPWSERPGLVGWKESDGERSISPLDHRGVAGRKQTIPSGLSKIQTGLPHLQTPAAVRTRRLQRGGVSQPGTVHHPFSPTGGVLCRQSRCRAHCAVCRWRHHCAFYGMSSHRGRQGQQERGRHLLVTPGSCPLHFAPRIPESDQLLLTPTEIHLQDPQAAATGPSGRPHPPLRLGGFTFCSSKVPEPPRHAFICSERAFSGLMALSLTIRLNKQ